MKDKIIITGSAGQLGSQLTQMLSLEQEYQVIPMTYGLLDISDGPTVAKVFWDIQPSIVINAAAYTRVDDCEGDGGTAYSVNEAGVENVAAATDLAEGKLIHISTDYVFDGKKSSPYVEDDKPQPINSYGASKLAGEVKVQECCHRHLILRTSWLYGLNGHNFVNTMLKLARRGEPISVVNDQRGTPTWTHNLAKQIKKLLPTNHYGIFHASSQGECTWYEFAEEIFKQARLDVDLRAVSSETFVQPAGRPAYSVLDNARLRELELDEMPHWQEGLAGFMRARSEHGMRVKE